MADSSQNTTGLIAFLFIFALAVVFTVSMQQTVIKNSIDAMFPNYEFITDVIPGEWIIMSRDLAPKDEFGTQRDKLNDIVFKIRNREYDANKTFNVLRGKKALREYTMNNDQTLYFINPYIAIFPLHIFLAGLIAFLISMYLPASSKLAWIRSKLMREYERVGSLLEKQFDAHGVDFKQMYKVSRTEREQLLRFTTLPQVVVTEVEDYISLHRYVEKQSRNFLIPVLFYFRYRISASYGNLIQGLVSGGAAILIFVIGLRGLKLIPQEEPSLILMALSIEFILLIVLMITFAGSAQEERLDRVVKELEAEQRDAIKHQTDTIQEVLGETRGYGGGGTSSGDSISDYEEQRLLDEVLSLMLKEAERKRSV
ncbi:MAG: hypothetical protein IH600_05410 [Bacteroidetes bacterium]|nr:hypothetical protein [Bacteroidota bacterium]